MPPRKNNGGLLARVNFPLYTVQMLTNRHILVGGGGGSAKTGVANGFVSTLKNKHNLNLSNVKLLQILFKL